MNGILANSAKTLLITLLVFGGGGGGGGKEKGAMKCSDGTDNDDDGRIDGADPDCQ